MKGVPIEQKLHFQNNEFRKDHKKNKTWFVLPGGSWISQITASVLMMTVVTH